MKAHGLKTVYDERLLYFFAFIQRYAKTLDDDGTHYKFSDLNEIIDLDGAEARLKGWDYTPAQSAAMKKINKYKALSERAKRAAELAKKQLAGKEEK